MNKLVCIFICIIFFVGLLSTYIHKVFAFLPDVLSAMIFIVVLLRVAAFRKIMVPPKYVFLGFVAFLHVLAGVVINQVPPGTIILGVRTYLKWIPVLLLPLVYTFSESEIRKQVTLVLFLALIQFPITFYQRFIQYKGVASGDGITGTLGANASGALSIFLLSVIAMLFAFYLKGKVSFRKFIFFSLLLFLPTTINETKVTLVLLPLIVVIPYIFASSRRLSIMQLGGITVLCISLISGFLVIYNQTASMLGSETMHTFFDQQAESYLYKGNVTNKKDTLKNNQIGNYLQLPTEEIRLAEVGGRVDQILLPLSTLSDQSVKLLVGLGVGNIMASSANIFTGEYSFRLGIIGNTTLLSLVIWETGIVGAMLVIIFILLLIMDTRHITKTSDYRSIIASGWMAVLVVAILSMPYTNILYFNVLIFLFAYFSGVMISEKQRINNSLISTK